MRFSPIEIWSLDSNNKIANIKITEPSLNYYQYYPETFLVSSDYCKQI